MARTQRPVIGPVDHLWNNAKECRLLQQTTHSDDARTHFDYAAGWHETAARILERAPNLRAQANALRKAAAVASKKRKHADAEAFIERAKQLDNAADVSPTHSDKFFRMALDRYSQAMKLHNPPIEEVEEPVFKRVELASSAAQEE